jgi:HSP20 family molecular chaperone IbpA
LVKKKVKVVPNLSAYHDDKEFTIHVELPGVKKENVAVDVTSDGFCVVAPREDFEYSSCYTLAHEIDPKRAKAKFASGLLTLNLPFKAKPRGKRIPVK